MFHSRLRSFSRLMISLTLAAGLMSLAAGARAQDKRQNAPGEFDFLLRGQQRRSADLPEVKMKRGVAVVGPAAGVGWRWFNRNANPARRQLRQQNGFHSRRFDQSPSPPPD